jgi:hypothetical protein
LRATTITHANLANTLAAYGQVMRVPEAEVIFEVGELADGVYKSKRDKFTFCCPITGVNPFGHAMSQREQSSAATPGTRPT